MDLLNVVPADAMAFPLYSLPAAANTVASLFAWLVAALAAAVGLWRIRAVGSSNKLPDAGARSSTLVDDKQQMQALSSPAADEPRPARTVPVEPASPISEPSSPSKVRFTAYYGGAGADAGNDGVVDGVRKCADRDEDEDGVPVVDDQSETLPRRTASMRIRSVASTAVPCWEEREMAVRRRGDLGWYRHLDMAVLDGTVVRLWDSEVTAAVASPRARRGRAGLELHLSL
ncbi:hypothetical protein CFC21_071653 [Triticum aestivum]|uniref:Uncharacterized protein n=3 Tax=Triticum TaxID=4564 RepID=A0A9R1HI85_WHEAT|nr:uncharacterized protein LOC123116185 [Triticum aestivum]KAF7065557.1 hypothetical protein CFC21_071651 [Triticum aestivum]KAF7065558.1 hypothetical protein CFC21_071652 [Triticum aestivum]KAF7065559.1 hypothetical protein CFC21_071653 [Triticum aestivum]VAI32522.1 unnamed protein product [Triticum turgidum subsp. durum]